MTNEDKTTLKSILNKQRVLSLSVLIENMPYVSLLPFSIRPDFDAVIVHASGMAKHSAGLYMDAPFSLLIHIPDSPEANPMVLPRVSIDGTVCPINKNSPEYNMSKENYTKKFPESSQLFGFGDFNLYQLNFEKGRYVANFGRIYNLTKEFISDLAE